MMFSVSIPLGFQELPSLSPNPVYIITLANFVIPPPIGGLALTGFFANPALAPGGASIADISKLFRTQWVDSHNRSHPHSYHRTLRCTSRYLAPAYSLGSQASDASSYSSYSPRPSVILFSAAVLRKLTGNPNLRGECKTKLAEMKTGEEFLWRPFLLILAALFINLYIGLTCAVFCLWFETFPLVFNTCHKELPRFLLLGPVL